MPDLIDLVTFLLHLDRYLDLLLTRYGSWTYGLLFLVIFAETGLVATPFLPGDSLLFAVGAFASRGVLDVTLLIIFLTAAAILGDTVNYWLGNKVGRRAFSGRYRFFKKEYLERTERFYERYGASTIVIARFVPIIRTFAPFVAGIGRMTYWRFLLFNVTGGIAWVVIFVLGGFFFGNIPIVKQNFTAAILIIIVVSLLPGMIGIWRSRTARQLRKR